MAATAAAGAGVLQAPASAATGTGGVARPTTWTRFAALSPAQVSRLAAGANQRVIVLLRNQASQVNPGLTHLDARTELTADAERSVVSELRALHAPRLHSYGLISAVSATVSKAERQRLAADPAVSQIVPDSVVKLHPAGSDSAGAAATASAAATVNRVPGTCPKNPRKPLLPEYLSVMHANAAQRIVTGKGVKVAVFPDGMDPSIPDYQRNGKSIIFDYRDFSGDGTKGVTDGAEAFGDVSSIAAQGRETFDLSKEVSPHFPLPAHCNIKVKGVAPGVGVAVMKVFGNADSAFNSEILEGLDWAVTHDHVDILSESIGGNPLPSVGTDDVIGAFDAAAVRNGITVVASTGDAGTTGTIGSPANAKGVIAAAGTTTYQIYAQTSTYGAMKGDKHGWVSNNIAPISSSGITQAAQTATVAAPADGNWADCSRNRKTYTACNNLYKGAKATLPIVPFGGTSEACPLIAGTAALVIQAYRKTHGGVTPSPATVKRILTSTATDIHADGIDEGSGLVNAERAVRLAESMPGSGHRPHRTGSSLLIRTNQVSHTAAPGSKFSFRETVTNTGTRATTVRPELTRFGAMRQVARKTVRLTKNDPTFLFLGQAGSAASTNYQVPFTTTYFRVPAGENRLITRVAWDGSVGSGVVRASLFDPRGRMVANSRPQGASGGFGEIQDNRPVAGRYKLVVFATSPPFFYGPVHVAAYAQKLVAKAGAVSPARALLKPGASRTFTVHAATPAAAGDTADTLRFGSAAGVVPVIERSLIEPTRASAARFSTVITGGNARPSLYGLSKFWNFNVPRGLSDVDVNLALPRKGYLMYGLLVDPRGVAQDVTASLLVSNPFSASPSASLLRTVHMSWARPVAGRWTLIAAIAQGQTSGLTSTRLSGSVSFNGDAVSATNLPNSPNTTITAGDSRTVSVKVKNTGNTAKYFFVDPRTNALQTITPFNNGTTSGDLPLSVTATIPQFIVPPFSNELNITAQSSPPSGSPLTPAPKIDFDSSPAFGTPDQLSTIGTTAVMTMTRGDLTASEYSCAPTIVKRGGFGSTPTKGGQFSCGAQVTTRGFDPNVTSSTGDLYTNPGTWNPVLIEPGQTKTITVTITAPATTQSRTLSGFLPVESFDPVTYSDDVWKVLDYSYTDAPLASSTP